MSEKPSFLPGPFTSEFIPRAANMSKPIFPPEIPEVGQIVRISFEEGYVTEVMILGRRIMGNQVIFLFFVATTQGNSYLRYTVANKEWIYFDVNGAEESVAKVSVIG